MLNSQFKKFIDDDGNIVLGKTKENYLYRDGVFCIRHYNPVEFFWRFTILLFFKNIKFKIIGKIRERQLRKRKKIKDKYYVVVFRATKGIEIEDVLKRDKIPQVDFHLLGEEQEDRLKGCIKESINTIKAVENWKSKV
jgi:hypothetical protein